MKVALRHKARVAWEVLKRSGSAYGRDHVPRMAAAVSYRTVFALAPMIFVGVSIAGFVLGGDADAQQRIVDSVRELLGQVFADNLNDVLDDALAQADSLALFGFLILLWSASTLFLELQRDLNEIFKVEIPHKRPFVVTLLQRGVGFLWTIGIGVSLLVLFAFNALWQTIADLILTNTTEGLRGLISVGGSVISFVFMVAIFGLVFQTLTFEKIPWRPIWIGALFTASIFTLAGVVTGIYVRILDTPSAVGVASSIVVVLFLAYLLSSVFLFGAQVTHSYWRLVYEAGRDRLIFPEQGLDESEKGSQSLSLATLGAFLIGLAVGWRNRDR